MKMDSSSLTTSNRQIKKKNNLFFHRYQYCFSLRLPMSHALRGLNHSCIDSAIDQSRELGLRFKNFGGSWKIADRQQANKKILHELCDMLLELNDLIFFTSTYNTVHVYTNDHDLILQKLNVIGIDQSMITVKEVSIVGSPEYLLLFNDHPYKWRSYFRNYACTPLIKKSLVSYLSAQENMRFSPSLNQWSNTNKTFLQRHFFVDYNQSEIIGLVDFIAPVIRKTLPIKTHK